MSETTIPKRTVLEWLQDMAKSNKSSDWDSIAMQTLLRRIGFPRSVCTLGVVYLDGIGRPLDIHSMAREILKNTGGVSCQQSQN